MRDGVSAQRRRHHTTHQSLELKKQQHDYATRQQRLRLRPRILRTQLRLLVRRGAARDHEPSEPPRPGAAAARCAAARLVAFAQKKSGVFGRTLYFLLDHSIAGPFLITAWLL